MYYTIELFYIEKLLLSHSHHGYLKGKSIETAVYDFVEKIVMGYENKDPSLGISLELSKAFDTISHGTLFNKLGLYGIRGPALGWTRSYLSEHVQKVPIDTNGKKYFPEEGQLKVGVSQ